MRKSFARNALAGILESFAKVAESVRRGKFIHPENGECFSRPFGAIGAAVPGVFGQLPAKFHERA
jgi:hypothetical protein